MKNKGNIKVEALLTRLFANGKTGIVLPYKESEGRAQTRIKHMNKLVEKGLLSKATRDKEAEKLRAITLDDETYNLFYECMGLAT